MTRNSCLLLAAAAAVLSSACALLGPDGTYLPKDPGTIVVAVVDQAGSPVANVSASVDDVPNDVGSTFAISRTTGRDGTATFEFVPAGLRHASIVPPPGTAIAGEAQLPVAVEKGQLVRVVFRVKRL